MSLGLGLKRGFESDFGIIFRGCKLVKMRGNNSLFIGETCGLKCVRLEFTCAKNKSYCCCPGRCNLLSGFG